MSYSRLFAVMEQLDKQHLLEFRKYLDSPYFKVRSRKRQLILLDYFVQYHPRLYHPDLESDNLRKKFGYGNVNNLKTQMHSALHDFSKIEEFKTSAAIK